MELISYLVNFCEVPPCQVQTSEVIHFLQNHLVQNVAVRVSWQAGHPCAVRGESRGLFKGGLSLGT